MIGTGVGVVVVALATNWLLKWIWCLKKFEECSTNAHGAASGCMNFLSNAGLHPRGENGRNCFAAHFGKFETWCGIEYGKCVSRWFVWKFDMPDFTYPKGCFECFPVLT